MTLFRLLKLRVAGLFLVVFSSCVLAEGKQVSIVFGIVPQQSATKLAKTWGPALQYFSQHLNVRFIFRTASDIPTFESRLAEGEYDFAYMNPYHFVVFNQSPGYRAVARAKGKQIIGIVVVRSDSSFTELKDLDDSVLAFPAPAAFAASILPQAHLKKLGVQFEPKYVSSHDSVYRAVAKDLYPAGGGVRRTFNSIAPEVRHKLRVLWESPGYTPHAVSVHPRVDDEFVKHFAALINKMDEDPEAIEILKGLNINGFVSARDSDWDDVRSLNLAAPVGAK